MKAYILKVEMIGLEPPVWRRVIVPAGATFQRLHAVIQEITNFQSEYMDWPLHFHEFRLPEEDLLITNEPEVYETFKKRKKGAGGQTVRKPQSLKIDDYLEKYGRLSYTYDFGDNWQFDIRLEKIVDDYYFGYPAVLDGAGDAPPEDAGGVPGFQQLLSVLADESHPDFEDMLWWSKEQHFDPYNRSRINSSLANQKIKKTEWNKIDHINYEVLSDKYLPIEKDTEWGALPADFDKELFWKYVKACTNLYGVVPLDQVVEVFNRQNPKMYIKSGQAFQVMTEADWKKRIEQSQVRRDGLNFIHQQVLESGTKAFIEGSGSGKNWYVPAKEELLRYTDDLYIEPTAAYLELYQKLEPNFHPLKPVSLPQALKEVMLVMQVETAATQAAQTLINISGFENERELNELIGLYSNFANHSRHWANRGHQPAELLPRENLMPLPDVPYEIAGNSEKVGRNDPCPCGSGKKYKKCCGA
ncbi:SEC-C metal-binding domain-containing protein [Planococcus sp. ISL-110]|uniref:IS1096 element passenger TnpR family protein n=1 Tax=Planococcus sp. ISL-110 TaxID=2819167 RepID=UPI001BEA3A82|nr:SEC-C metal-binding domain-containing protein [Planococcus sp. ISL-110]MBT2571308.1 SEC-C domain-containing protein [Planococcus sp. ISL-110]